MSRTIVEVAGQRLSLSNLKKDLYPSYGFTKARIIEYYRRLANVILPHLKNRALTLKRYPDGVERDFFFEKRCPSHRPAWVKTAEAHHNEEHITVCLVNNLETLIWVEILASIELHEPLAMVDSPERPDAMVFDLDPGNHAGILDCARVALILRDLLFQMKLASYAKTSGKKGLHVYVPLNHKETTFEQTRKFSKAVAEVIQRNYSESRNDFIHFLTGISYQNLRFKNIFKSIVGANGRSPLRMKPKSLSSFIAGFKSAVTKQINILSIILHNGTMTKTIPLFTCRLISDLNLCRNKQKLHLLV